MGLLDDAIREHLDLKRKHGATDEELERQETEALGPARRDFTAAAPAEEPVEAESLPAAEATQPADEPEGWLDDEPGAAPFDAAAEAAVQPVERPAVAPEPPPSEPAPEPVEEPPAEPAPRLPGDTPQRGFPAVGRDEDAHEDGPDEDVLEETPDFLQDTPEHDRLWFEQKPPRDFDFDD